MIHGKSYKPQIKASTTVYTKKTLFFLEVVVVVVVVVAVVTVFFIGAYLYNFATLTLKAT